MDDPGRRRRVQAPAGDERRRERSQKRKIDAEPALHRAAAALFGSLAGQAHGGARHRPALDLCVDPAGAQGPRLCAHRQEAAGARGQRPRADRVPRKLLRPLRRVRFHRRPGGAARPHLQQRDGLARSVARLLARFHRRGRRHQGAARRAGHRRARRDAGAAPLPAARGRHRSAQMPELRDRPALAQARQVRRLHRLHQLSGMPLYAPVRAGQRRQRRRRHEEARRGSGERPRSDAALRPLRPLSAARRGGRRREAQARRLAERPFARRHRSRHARSACSRCRARSASIPTTASRSSPASAASAPMCSTARPTPT